MKKLCDLHTHSCFSDGTDTPEELVRAAIAADLSAVALCDHNTVAGIPDFLAAAGAAGIEAVPGIEFSVDHNGQELHMLGLFITPEHYGKVTALLDEVRMKKEKSNMALAEALSRAGYDIDYGEIKAKSGGYVNRAHFATEMVEKGYAESLKQAFNTYLSTDAGYYKAPERLLAVDVIKFIRSIGAVAVLAHPFLNLCEKGLREFLPVAKAAGLSGMETDYSTYSEETTAIARRLADEFGILRSGGSDYHGKRKPDISIGSGRGELAVPYSYLEALKDERGCGAL